ncbi:hypothetical protein WJX75_007010 [Coccomyxa subellipsoidea]|uniref:Rho termination factor-like N-terminal domain-containing protein n=1 Tax=Coccomyxa subellipsoidea TaxID=248742 RepID=A0ABR2YTT9_9CHLO
MCLSSRLFGAARTASKKADADLQLVKREETSDGAILFVFGDEAAVAANKSAEPADSPAPAQEPEAAYEAVRAEKVEKGAAAAGEEAAALSNGAVVPDFSEDPDPDELLSDEDAPDLQDEIAKTLTSLRVADLKEMCKERKITGYSKMRKSQLEVAVDDPLLEPRSIFLEDKLPYEPGAGFVLSQEPPSLSCSGLDPSTHELWLLQLPLDWQSKAPAKITMKRRKGDSLLGECTSATGDRFSLVQEHASLASPLFVASATLKDGVPAQIHRRVTLVRSSSSVREDTVGVPSAQQPAAEPSSRSDGEPPKRKKAKAAQQGSQQADTKELRLEDIVVKQESPNGKQQKEKKKKKKKDKGDSAGVGKASSP